MTGFSAQAKIVPLVPRLAVTWPGFVFPVQRGHHVFKATRGDDDIACSPHAAES
jgi:hypothetical protein